MLNAIIGMLKWKIRMKKLKNMQPYTEEWWNEMFDALQFVPEQARERMMNGFIQLALSL